MDLVAGLGAWALGSLPSYDLSQYVPGSFFGHTASSIEVDLAPLLSPNASIIFGGSPEFEKATARWQEYNSPGINIVVEAASESDVQETVRLSSQNS